jgi:hypothetical protein
LLGAESLGRSGSRFLEERLRIKIGEGQWMHSKNPNPLTHKGFKTKI